MNIKKFKQICKNCHSIQKELLFSIIKENKNSLFGQKHHFSKIKTIQDFRNYVNPTNWRDIEPYTISSFQGKPHQLFKGDPKVFIVTSGTTGKEKILPESPKGLEVKNLITKLRIEALKEIFPKISEGMMLPLVNKILFPPSKKNIPVGCASGISLIKAPKTLIRTCAYPLEILDIKDPLALDYTLMRFALTQDVRLIIGNNAARLKQLVNTVIKYQDIILKDIANGTLSSIFNIPTKIRKSLNPFLRPQPQQANLLKHQMIKNKSPLTPKNYWPNLQVISCWLGGSVGRYVETIRNMFPNISFMECGYGASEGKFTIPLKAETPAAPLAIFGIFFEFCLPDDKKNFLLAHELEKGKVYEMYITTWSGLYRYAMHDLVRVESFTGTTPNIIFESKSGEIANICGEKSSPLLISKAVNEMQKNLSIAITHWCMVVDNKNFCYLFCIELKTIPDSINSLLKKISEEIEKQLFGDGLLPYGVFRKQNFLNAAKVILMKPGWYEAWKSSKLKPGDTGNQLKLPLICKEIPLPEYILNNKF